MSPIPLFMGFIKKLITFDEVTGNAIWHDCHCRFCHCSPQACGDSPVKPSAGWQWGASPASCHCDPSPARGICFTLEKIEYWDF